MEMLDAPGQVHVSGPHCCRLAGPSFQPMENITFQMESQVAEQEEEFQKPKYIFHGFMERLWAYLTIHQLLERMWVACTPKGLMGQPHTASMPPQGPQGWESSGGLGISYVWRVGVQGVVSELQTLPVGTLPFTPKGLEGRESGARHPGT